MKLVYDSAGTSKSGLCSPMWPACLSTWKNVFFNAYEAGRQCAVAASETRLTCKKKQSAYQKIKNKNEHEKSLVFLGRKSCMAVCLLITPGVPMLSVQPKGKQKGCAGCNRKIKDRYLLKALDKYWHEDCLKCACCDCRLGEVGSTLYTKANLILCRRDYLRQERHTHTHTLLHSRQTQKSRHFHSCLMSKGQRFLSTAFSEMWKKQNKIYTTHEAWPRSGTKGWYYLSLSFIFAPLDGCCVSIP